MDSRWDYFQKLYDDLLEQFRGKPNITVFQKALARQLEELYAFFYALRVLRWLQTAEGKQLDGIGDIVVLSRMDALIMGQMAGQTAPMDDALYRLYLAFKIFLNTSNGTYKDVYRALKMFWTQTPIYYSERTESPATMFWTLQDVNPFSTDASLLAIATMVKAGGVALRFVFQWDIEADTTYHAGVMQDVWAEHFIEELEIATDAATYHAGAMLEVVTEHFAEDTEFATNTTAYHAGAMLESWAEHYVEEEKPNG